MKQLRLAHLGGHHDVLSMILTDQGDGRILSPKICATRAIGADQQQPKWLAQAVFTQGQSRALQIQLMHDHAAKIAPWSDICLPDNIKDWERMVNLHADSTLEDSLIKTYNLGMLLVQTGLLNSHEIALSH